MLTYIERKTPDYEIKFGDEIAVKFIKTVKKIKTKLLV